MDVYNTFDGLFFAYAFDLVAVFELHDDGIAGRGYVLGEAFDFAEGLLEAVPLGFVLFAAFGFGDGVLEDGIILIERN